MVIATEAPAGEWRLLKGPDFLEIIGNDCFKERDCPGGTPENSPAFQRWVSAVAATSPEGTADSRPLRPARFPPSLRDL